MPYKSSHKWFVVLVNSRKKGEMKLSNPQTLHTTPFKDLCLLLTVPYTGVLISPSGDSFTDGLDSAQEKPQSIKLQVMRLQGTRKIST